MPDPTPTLLAFDFDGVLCDGMIEYFQAAWRAYCRVWNQPNSIPPEGLDASFYRTRPVVETGWEMPLVLRSLRSGIPETDILLNWEAIAKQQVAQESLTPADLSAAVDGVRDEWITQDLDDWLAQHRFYPGVIERLKQVLASPVQTVIISTKETRFILQLLQQQGIEMTAAQVFGKDVKQPKAQTLRQLKQKALETSGTAPQIWFIEDRFKTLLGIKTQPDLEEVELFLADWGYNIATERAAAQQDDRIHLISLAQFTQPYSSWI